jgi:periplasmic protein TonB
MKNVCIVILFSGLCIHSAFSNTHVSFRKSIGIDTLQQKTNDNQDLYPVAINRNDSAKSNNDNIYLIADEMPKFRKGGIGKFQEFVFHHLRYPDAAMRQGISGRVIIQFVVDEQGEVTDITIIKSAHPLLDKEAIRLVKKSSSKWTPGKNNGTPVKVKIVFPITFIIQ